MSQHEESKRHDDRSQKSSNHRLKGLTDRMPEDKAGVVLLMDTWARLVKRAPQPERAVGYITDTHGLGLSYADIDHMRQVRNCCAHPDRDGWPSPGDLNHALHTAHALHQLTLGLRLT